MNARGEAPSAEVKAKLRRLIYREQQVLELICRGTSSADIARAMGVAKNTLRNYVSSLYKKLGVHRGLNSSSGLDGTASLSRG